jgi:hypothetical protein
LKLKIFLRRETQLIEQVFLEMEKGSFKTQMQAKVFKALYLSRTNVLFGLVKRKLRGFAVEEGKDFIVTEEEGSEDYILLEEKRLKAFLDSDEATLQKEQEYQHFMSDRSILRFLSYMRLKGLQFKNGLIQKALGSGDVFSFLNTCGLSVRWEILP